MSAYKGTPGPWSVGVEDANSGEIEVVSEARPYVCMVLPGAIDGTTAANARLIAAAPDLLEALRPFAALDLRPDGFDKSDDSQPVYARDNSVITVGDVRRAVAAIAKATGEQP